MSDFDPQWLLTPFSKLNDEQLKLVAEFHPDFLKSRSCAYMIELRTELAAERERADRAEAERDRLLALIADEAMHDIDCQSIRIKDDGCGPVMVTAYPSKDCNCWVSKVARTGGDE